MAEQHFKKQQKEIEALVVQAQKGQTDAFAKLYDVFIQSVYRYIYFRVPREEALDLTESVFLKVWEHLASYRPNKASFAAWIFRIAHNIVVDYYRVHRQLAPLDYAMKDEKSEANPVLMAERGLSRDRLKSALAKLKKKYQQVLLLKYVSELENMEIAKIMRRSEGSLRVLQFRALRALRKVLEEEGAQ